MRLGALAVALAVVTPLLAGCLSPGSGEGAVAELYTRGPFRDIHDGPVTVKEAKNLLFVLPVDDAGMDTPYATLSRRERLMRSALENRFSGCAA